MSVKRNVTVPWGSSLKHPNGNRTPRPKPGAHPRIHHFDRLCCYRTNHQAGTAGQTGQAETRRPDMSPVPSCPRHGPVHDPHDATCPALIPRVIAGDLEIVRCALPLEAHEVELVLAVTPAEPDVPERHRHLHSLADRLRRRKRVLVS